MLNSVNSLTVSVSVAKLKCVVISDDGNHNEDTPGVDYECECTADYFGDHCENGKKITETSK